MKSAVFVLLSVLAVSTLAEQKRYDGYQVYRVTAKDENSIRALVRLQNQGVDFDFWSSPRRIGHPVDIMVPPQLTAVFVQLLEAYGMDYRVKIANVQASIERTRMDILPQGVAKDGSPSPRYNLNWNGYSGYSNIVEFLSQVADRNPTLTSLIVLGESYQGNLVKMMKISTGGTGKKAIFVDGGIRPREWIGPAFCTWLIHELVENYANHPQLVDNIDWYIVPVVNPDGYLWTFNVNGDPLWNKNRAPDNQGSICLGTDLDSNFDFHWNEGGSSGAACTQSYHGGAPFNQAESRLLRDALLSVANQTKVYMTMRSYGQHWMMPYAYTIDVPDNYPQMFNLARSAVASLTAYNGTKYDFGNYHGLHTVHSGGVDDWAKGVAGIEYVYHVEMRDTGLDGYQLPAVQILPNNYEVWEGVKVIAKAVLQMQ